MSNDFPYELNERMRQNAGERPPELGQALTSVRRSQQGRTHIQVSILADSFCLT